MKNNISRRDFLKTAAAGTAGVAGGAALLTTSGCEDDLFSSFAIPRFAMNTLGTTSYSATMAEYNLSQHAEWTGWVKNSGDRVKEATIAHENNSRRISGFNWNYNLIADNTINAWCMPGANIAFYEGIMPTCYNETGTAIVMGHEVAHAVYNHGGQRMAQQLTLQLGITLFSAALAARFEDPNDAEIQNIALQVFGVGVQVGGQLALLHYSRKHEYEADKMGLIYAARAGYDPVEAPDFWRRMSALGSSATPEFLRTHPSNANRIRELEKAIPEAREYYQESQRS